MLNKLSVIRRPQIPLMRKVTIKYIHCRKTLATANLKVRETQSPKELMYPADEDKKATILDQ